MESIEVVRTLSWLKQELMRVNGIRTNPPEIRLFFSNEKNELYVHAFKDHKMKLRLGGLTFENKNLYFQNILKEEVLRLINYGISCLKVNEKNIEALTIWLNECVKEYGYYKD